MNARETVQRLLIEFHIIILHQFQTNFSAPALRRPTVAVAELENLLNDILKTKNTFEFHPFIAANVRIRIQFSVTNAHLRTQYVLCARYLNKLQPLIGPINVCEIIVIVK